ncbi:Hypothetical predicted protein, partial [Paramuricea clavata]
PDDTFSVFSPKGKSWIILALVINVRSDQAHGGKHDVLGGCSDTELDLQCYKPNFISYDRQDLSTAAPVAAVFVALHHSFK